MATTTICIYKLSLVFFTSTNNKSLHRMGYGGEQRPFWLSKQVHFFFPFVVQKQREACESFRLQRTITALCTLAMLRVIFHNHPNPTTPFCPHQYLPLIRPPLPSLPLGRRHLYSAALCLATSAGAAILDRGAHDFNVNKSVSPWALLEWLPCAHQHPLRLGIMPYLGRAPAVYRGVGCFVTPGLWAFFFFLNASS